MKRLTKAAPTRRPCFFAEFKALDAKAGTFEGYLSVFGNTDSYNDIVDPGAFSKTLQEAKAAADASQSPYLFPILWQHNPNEPIGGFTGAREDTKGLYVVGQLDLDIPEGKRAYSALTKGYTRGMSIGYITQKDAWAGDIRHLKEIQLLEGSVVTFPANPLAQVEGVKARDFNATLAALDAGGELQDGWGDAFKAFVQSSYATMADPTVEDKAAAMSTSLDQFKTAVLALVNKSVEAGFVPMLDEDGDSFLDPDAPEDEDEDDGDRGDCPICGFDLNRIKSADAIREYKAGRRFSASNASQISDIAAKMRKHAQGINDHADTLDAMLNDGGKDDSKTEPDGDDTTSGKDKNKSAAQPDANETTQANTNDVDTADAETVLAMLRLMRLRNDTARTAE